MTDGCIAVIPHDPKQHAISDSKTKEEKHLNSTVDKGDCSEQRQQIYEHLGQDDKSVASLRDGKNPQEEVHRYVEAAIQAYDSDDSDVPAENDQIQAQKYSKEDELDFPKVGEPQQQELGDRGEISLADLVPEVDLRRTGMKKQIVYPERCR